MGCVYGTSENAASMMVLFDELWNAGLSKAKQIIFISDNGSGINLFIKNLQNEHSGVRENHVEIEHVLCVAHLLRSIRHVLEKVNGLKNFDKIRMLFFFARRSPTKELADYYLEWIRKLSPEAHVYIINKCMSVFIYQYKTPHYFADTNNVSESLMQMLRNILVLSESARKTAIFGCIYRAIIISLLQMYKRKELVESVDDEEMYYRDKYNYFCNYIVQEMVHLGYTYEVVSNNYKVLVEKSNEAEEEWVVKDDEWNNEYTINLKKRCCSCLYFQQNKAPCIHAIAVLHFNHQYHQVMSYVDEHYKSFNIFKSIPILNYDSIMSLGKSISSKSKLSVEQEKLIENLEIYDFKKAKLERRKRSTGEILTREETKKARKEANGYEKIIYIEKTGNDVSTLFTIPLDN